MRLQKLILFSCNDLLNQGVIDTITLWFNVKVGPQDIHLGLYNTFAESREGERDTTNYIYLAKVKKRIS